MEQNQLTVTSSHIFPPLQPNSFSWSELMKITIFINLSVYTFFPKIKQSCFSNIYKSSTKRFETVDFWYL